MEQRLRDHIDVLQTRVFEVDTKWPHFQLLIDDLVDMADRLPAGSRVVSLERNHLYGGFSLFAPLFERQDFISVDCSPGSAPARGAYNAGLIEDSRFLRVPTRMNAPVDAIPITDGSADVVVIPNLVHHIENQRAMFGEARRLLKPGGELYVFEPLVRELHQVPDDYLRYTPYGLASVLRDAGLAPGAPKTNGGPFSVIAYCWTQALQYLPEDERAARQQWFEQEHFPELMRLDNEHPQNLVRKHTSFPMGFSLSATKPH